jgi:membrane protein DedA with SNARE-associated domain
VYGLIAGLMVEAWIAIPGEALIAVAAARVVRRAWAVLQVAGAGVAGMLVNDVALFAVSRVARGFAHRVAHAPGWHLHLNALEVLAAKFFPPLRSAAFVLYGIQGTQFSHFLWVSLLTSAAWIAVYILLGHVFRGRILQGLHLLDSRGKLATFAEFALTVATVLLVVRPV